MNHQKKNRKFGRVRKQRQALLRSLARALILHGKIQTTEAKAKELRSYIEKMVTKSNLETVASYKLLVARLGGEETVAKRLRDEIAPKYKDRNGGYTRIIKLSTPSHDARSQAVIEFV